MKQLIKLFSLFLIISLSCGYKYEKITGGQEAGINQFPYQAAILLKINGEPNICGGSLISNTWILTAAHCVDKNAGITIDEVVLGAHRYKDDGVHKKVKQFFTHEDWNPEVTNNDVGLIEIEHVDYSDAIKPIRLTSDNQDYVGSPATVSGWGIYSDAIGQHSDVLRYVTSSVIRNWVCAEAYMGDTPILDFHVCIDGTGGKSACVGDSGGPLATTFNDEPLQIGVVSFGSEQGCEKDIPSVFVRVAVFRDWINQHTGV